MSMQEKSPKKSRCKKGDWLTCTFPHWIPESTEKVTQVVDVFLPKSTPNQRRGGREISGREGEKGGIAHLVLNLRHWIPSPMRSCCPAQKKRPNQRFGEIQGAWSMNSPDLVSKLPIPPASTPGCLAGF